MRTWINIIGIKILNWRVRRAKSYIQLKYRNPKCDICIISTGPMEDTLSFQSSMTEGVVPVRAHKSIRRLIGSNLLMLYGLPYNSDDVPYIKLILTWSAIKMLGRNIFKFRKEWKGESKVGEVTVVRYII